MSGFKINFKLRPLERIAPWGVKEKSLSWFGMTDGELWITVGNRTVYEYSDAALRAWGGDTRYNDYQLSRFLEDFSYTFEHIRESVPRELYDSIGEMPALFDKWRKLHDNYDDEIFDRLFDEEYLPLTEWFYDRVFDSGHLVGGPRIGCFRRGEMIKLWWRGDYLLENGESIWTSPRGVYELSYNDFAAEIKRFFGEFHAEMDGQVKRALAMDWGTVRVDKEYLVKENQERKDGFSQKLALLGEDFRKTNWSKPAELFEKMKKDLNCDDI